MTKRIYAVTTKAGIITRTTASKEYTHAVVINEWPITWCSRYDLAVKAQRKEGGNIAEVTQLEKQPADPHKGIKIIEGYIDDRHRVYCLTDRDGAHYVYNNNEYNKAYEVGWTKVTEIPDMTYIHEFKGYLDRLAVIYKFNTWKDNVS